MLFLDGGNVWTNPWDFNCNDMRYDVGPGIRYNTPVGPVRLDLGLPAQSDSWPARQRRAADARQFRFHFSIGQAF